MTQDMNLVFVPLGGTGEIGMNLNLYGYGTPANREWIMVDCGVTFGDGRDPGIDVIMPDTRFIEQYKKQLQGIVLTHGHEDHIGAVAYLWPRLRCPIYATRFTAELVKLKLEEAGLAQEAPLHILDLEGHIDLGAFSIDFIGLTHSIAEPFALAIRTPLGNILHTGDWKIDPFPLIGKVTDSDKLIAFGDEGIDAIICDSTNVLSPGFSGSETDVAQGLVETIAESTGRVVVTTFASNVARLEAIGQAALKTERHLTMIGRGMHRIYTAARKTGYLKNFPKLLSEEDAGYVPPDKLLILCTGSQGEARAALSRIAAGKQPHLVLEKGDTVIFSSKVIPGNEIAIAGLQNRLASLGVTILTTGERLLHVSGHPNREELVQMYDWVKPKCAVPVHGEHRHLLAHAALAKELGVKVAICAQNGDLIKLLPGAPKIIDVVASGRVHLDGDVLVDAAESATIVRRKLAHSGVVSVGLAIDKAGRLAAKPEVKLLGLPEDDGRGIRLEDWVLDAVARALPENGKITPKRATETISLYIRREMRRRWGKKPEILVNFCYI